MNVGGGGVSIHGRLSSSVHTFTSIQRVTMLGLNLGMMSYLSTFVHMCNDKFKAQFYNVSTRQEHSLLTCHQREWWVFG